VQTVAEVKQLVAEKQVAELDQEVSISGRMMSKREHGKTVFIDIKDRTGSLQVYCKSDLLTPRSFCSFDASD
jgi:lysyl-tRNA synthetase class 2